MRYLIDATTARHSGALTDFVGILPALDKLLNQPNEQCLVLGTPQLAKAIAGSLATIDLQVLELGEGYKRALGLNTAVKKTTGEYQPHAALYGLFASLGAAYPYVLRYTNPTLVDPGFAYCNQFLDLRTRLANRVRKQYFRNSALGASSTVCSAEAAGKMLAAWEPKLRGDQIVNAHFGPPQLLEQGTHADMVGRRLLTMHISPHKNAELLLRALALPQLNGWSLSILGNLDTRKDKYARFLHRIIRERGLESRVHFLGYMSSKQQLLEALHSHDILVIPSRVETWSHTVVEGMALGMPVIASDIPTHREVAGGAAWFTGVDDPAMLAETVLDVAANREERLAHIARGNEIVNGLTWSSHAQAILTALRKAAGNPQATS